MVFKILILGLAVLGVIFVIAPFFNYAVFDFQCEETVCGGDICRAKRVYTQQYRIACVNGQPEIGCGKNCEVRNFKCSFDHELQTNCTRCIQDCKVKFSLNVGQPEEVQECFESCYNTNTTKV